VKAWTRSRLLCADCRVHSVPNVVRPACTGRDRPLGSISLLAAVAAMCVMAQRVGAQVVTPASDTSATSAVELSSKSGVDALHRRISIDFTNVRLRDALLEIARRAGIGIVHGDSVAADERSVTVHLKNATVNDVLRAVLKGSGYRPTLSKAGMIVIVRDSRRAEVSTGTGEVYGRIRDSTTVQPLMGAVVVARGTTLKVVTNDSGFYVLSHIPAGVNTIVVRMLGYAPEEREVVVVDSQTVRADFALRMGMSRLPEVVTTATGSRRRLEVANDITIIRVDSVLQTAPIRSVTDLLESRVPGLTVQHTSGAPGDPSRLRLRGASSIYANNDPIIIVDGVRVYSAQSDPRSGNLTSASINATSPASTGTYAAPSPLDQIDPESIETIEVLKGPSAATLYGTDAANGVIVITTRRGRPGPAHWRASASRGLSYMPGQYPDAYLRFGHDYTGDLLFCTLGSPCGVGVDSLVRFQALNAPDLTILDHGNATEMSLGVDGGSAGLSYSFTGTMHDETGILKLPDYEFTRYQELHGATPPDWMQNPQSLSRWSWTGNMLAHLGRSADVSVTSTLTRETQQRSSLDTQLSALMSTYVDRASGTFYQITTNGNASGNYQLTNVLVPDFYRRVTDQATNFTNGATLNWHPSTWLTGSVDAGLNVIDRKDEALLPRDMLDTLGSLSSADGSSVVSTVNLRAVATKSLPLGFTLQFATGANYTKTSIADLSTNVQGLAAGTTGLNGAGIVGAPSENVSDAANAGWYVEPSFAHKRYFFSAGLRLDGGSTYGTHVSLPTFPKLGGSWLISDESWFPFKSLFDILRLRAAYGHAGVQPGIADRLRLYGSSNAFVNGGIAQVYTLSQLGNTRLRPERSTELESGFDADLLDDRVSVTFSAYRKLRKDALLQVPVAPSVYGNNVNIWENIGVVRNTGVEATLTTQLLRTDLLTWSWTLGVSRNNNLVVSLADGVQPFNVGIDQRIAPGYPLYGMWAKPIVGFADANHDGIIEPDEVQVGDTLAYMGEAAPRYEASLHTTFSFMRGAIRVDAGLDYQNGLTQLNTVAKNNRILSQAANDPGAPFSEQAAVVVLDQTDYGLIQTVNTLRFNSLSVAFNASPTLARRFGMSALSIALQGSNLGLFTNYRGKDPNVNAYASGNLVADTGVLPQPRSWQLVVSTHY